MHIQEPIKHIRMIAYWRENGYWMWNENNNKTVVKLGVDEW